MMDETGILLIGHGSALPFNSLVFKDIKDKIEKKTGIRTEMGYLKLTKPSIEDAIKKLNKDRIIAQPLMLCDGIITKEKIPEKLTDNVKLLDAIGFNTVLCDIINDKIENALSKSKLGDVSTEIILLTHGSKLEYNEQFLKEIASSLQCEYPINYSFMRYNEPKIQDVFKKIESERVVVAPLFVTDGIHTITDIPIMLGLIEPPEPCPHMKNGKHHPDHAEMRKNDHTHKHRQQDIEIIEYDGEVLLTDSFNDDDRLVDLWCENIMNTI